MLTLTNMECDVPVKSISRYFIYKQALLKEAKQLVQAGVIHEKEDVFYLTYEQLRDVVCTNKLDYQIISKQKDEYKVYDKLTLLVLLRQMVKSLWVSTNERISQPKLL